MAFQVFSVNFGTAVPPKLTLKERVGLKAAATGKPVDKIDIRMESTDDSADLYLHDAIDSWFGITVEDVREAIADVGKDKRLNVHINSPGGEVFAGTAIYNLLANRGNVTTYNDGLAASMGSVIALAGDEFFVGQGTQYMVHKPLLGMWGNSNDLKAGIDLLDAIESGMADLYEQESTSSRKDIEKWINNKSGFGTFMTAEESISRGFANGYTKQPTRPITQEEAIEQSTAYWKAHLMIAKAKTKIS